MNAALWAGTPVQAWLLENWKNPAFRQSYYVGAIETAVADIFGAELDENAPAAAQELARELFDAFTSRDAGAAQRAVSIMRRFRALGVN
jgi:hypothetical protein